MRECIDIISNNWRELMQYCLWLINKSQIISVYRWWPMADQPTLRTSSNTDRSRTFQFCRNCLRGWLLSSCWSTWPPSSCCPISSLLIEPTTRLRRRYWKCCRIFCSRSTEASSRSTRSTKEYCFVDSMCHMVSAAQSTAGLRHICTAAYSTSVVGRPCQRRSQYFMAFLKGRSLDRSFFCYILLIWCNWSKVTTWVLIFMLMILRSTVHADHQQHSRCSIVWQYA